MSAFRPLFALLYDVFGLIAAGVTLWWLGRILRFWATSRGKCPVCEHEAEP